MPRITKKQSFLRKNFSYFYGAFFLICGILQLLLENRIVFYLYLPIGIGSIYYGYYYRNKTQEFIEWDKDQISLKDLIAGEQIYPWTKVDDVSISQNHLTIKSGAANGIMLELKGYEKEDLERLRSFLSSFSLPA